MVVLLIHAASLVVLGEKTTLMSPDVLVARGVPRCRLLQYPREFVVTFPRAYHIGFSHGISNGGVDMTTDTEHPPTIDNYQTSNNGSE
ncbi:putative lysine-specific demethylase ELF6, partial [Zea mays]